MTATATRYAAATDYACPTWCERTDHDLDVVGPGYPPMHHGPDFGNVGVCGVAGATPHAIAWDVEGTQLTAGDLRDLARNALAAAAWLDGDSTTTRPLAEVTVPEVEQAATTLGVDPGELLAALHPAGGVLHTGHVPQYVTIAEAARLLGTRPWYVALAVERGELPAVKHEGQTLVPARSADSGEHGWEG